MNEDSKRKAHGRRRRRLPRQLWRELVTVENKGDGFQLLTEWFDLLQVSHVRSIPLGWSAYTAGARSEIHTPAGYYMVTAEPQELVDMARGPRRRRVRGATLDPRAVRNVAHAGVDWVCAILSEMEPPSSPEEREQWVRLLTEYLDAHARGVGISIVGEPRE